jgi:hypothetical protein
MSTSTSESTSESQEKSVVVVITTHGAMKVSIGKTGLLKPILAPKPTNMNVVLLQAAVCGVVNFIGSTEISSYVKAINGVVKASGFNDNTTKEDMVKIAESIRTKLLQLDNMREQVAQEISEKNPDFVGDPQTMDYIHHKNKFYNIYDNDYLIDKQFSRANELTTPRGKIWKVNLLGKNSEDLMAKMNPNVSSLRNSSKRKENSVLYMSGIIRELEKRGIENALIIDLSCSVIDNTLSDRDIRHARSTFMKRSKTPKAKAKAKFATPKATVKMRKGAKSISTRRTRSSLV